MFNALSTFILVLASFSLLDQVAAGPNICTFTTRPCAGFSACCNNIPPDVCCQWGSSFGAGVQFIDMPQPWFGYTFGPVACAGQPATGGSSTGNLCLYTQPNQNFYAARWLAQPFFRRGEEIEARDDAAAANCASPDTISYTTAEGVERVIKVPEGQFERLSGLIEVESFQAEFALLEDA